ncbi:Hypothetical predicted protein [Octopus vulgaris]|uniref:TNF family profile domain-containing protein n=1 Tax=Octopus vulgaris TaxID=6645 RepID=A0AA36FJS0_OCTVU|nr:Hypothetical predicted protein [Octopus vulgaris]
MPPAETEILPNPDENHPENPEEADQRKDEQQALVESPNNTNDNTSKDDPPAQVDKEKSRCQKIVDTTYYKYGSLFCIIILFVAVVVVASIKLTQRKYPPSLPPPPPHYVAPTSPLLVAITSTLPATLPPATPLPATPPPPPFHHSFFLLKTRGYTELESLTNLQWMKVMNKSKGDIKLLDRTYFYVPGDGIYLIQCTIQIYIPKNTTEFHMFVTLEEKNGKQYEYIKKTLSTLTASEHTRIPLTSTQYLKAYENIYLRMNKVKYISPDKNSSRCSITSLHLDKPQ